MCAFNGGVLDGLIGGLCVTLIYGTVVLDEKIGILNGMAF